MSQDRTGSKRPSFYQWNEILESINEGFLVLDRHWHCSFVNKLAAQNLQLQTEDLLGKNIWVLFPQLKGTEIEARYKKAMADGGVQIFKTQIILTNHWYNVRAYPFSGGIAVCWQDITEYHEKEELLKDRESYFKAFYQYSLDAIMLTSPDGGIYAANPAACRLFQMTEDEIRKVGRNGLLDPSDPRINSAVAERSRNKVYKGELNYKRKDGTIFPGESTSAFFTDHQSRLRTIVIVRDVSERKRAEEELKESQALFRSFFESPGTMRGIAEVVDADTVRHIVDNQDTARFLGLPREELQNKLSSELGEPPGVVRKWIDACKKSQMTGKPVVFEYIDKRRGREVRLSDAVTFIDTTPEGYHRFAFVIHDVTRRKKAEKALKQSEEKYRSLFENMSEGFVLGCPVLDPNGQPYDIRFLDVNRAWEDWTKIPRRDALGKTYRELFPRPLPELIERLTKVALIGQPDALEIYSPYADTWVSGNIYSPVKGRFAVVFNDVTLRKKAEEGLTRARDELEIRVQERTDELRQSKEEIQKNLQTTEKILSGISDALFMIDMNWCFTYVNLQGLALARKTKDEMIGKCLWEVSPHLTGTEIERRFYNAMEESRQDVFEYHDAPRDIWVECRLYPTEDGLLEFVTDITERKKAEEDGIQIQMELAEANEQLKQYAKKITEVQETERKRIAYELHDDTAQYLSILKMQIGALVNSEEIRSEKIREKLGFLEKDADRAYNDVRRYSHELRPVILEHQGLAAALEQIADDYNKMGQFSVKINVEGVEPGLSEDFKLGFFRIAQEALNNIRKHSKASQVGIDLKYNLKQLVMVINDNGSGFDSKKALKRAGNEGSLGLMSMRERADLIDADLKIVSEPGKGTRVILKAKL